MAKKLNKLVARVVALEHALAKFLGGKKPKSSRKAKKAKPASANKPAAKKPKKAHKPAAKAKSASPAKKSPKKASGKKRRMPIPTIEQLAVSGEPQFVTPLDKV
jgi:hypothetical protein